MRVAAFILFPFGLISLCPFDAIAVNEFSAIIPDPNPANGDDDEDDDEEREESESESEKMMVLFGPLVIGGSHQMSTFTDFDFVVDALHLI